MKVVKNTSGCLVIQSAPAHLLTVALVVIIGFGVSLTKFLGDGVPPHPLAITSLLYTTWLFGRFDSIVLNRLGGEAVLTKYTVFGKHQRIFQLRDVAEANLAGPKRRSALNLQPWNLNLVINRGPNIGNHTIQSAWPIKSPVDAANAINTWLSMDVDSTPAKA